MDRPDPASGERPFRENMLDRQTTEAAQVDLLRRIAARDHEALAAFYNQVAGVLFSTAVHILGDPREAEEVVQDVFVQVWNKAETFEVTLGTPLPWALGITRNRCIDYLRSRQRRSRLLDEASQEAMDGSVSSSPPARGALTPDELAAVRAAVQRLPEEQNQAIAMAFFGGMTHPEIAEALHQPLGTVKARIRRGMLRLKESLEPYVV